MSCLSSEVYGTTVTAVALLLGRRLFLNGFLELPETLQGLRERLITEGLGLYRGLLSPLGLECTVFLVLGTLSSIVCTSHAPMFLAKGTMFLDALFLGNPITGGVCTLTLSMLLGISVRFCVSSVVAVGRRLRYNGICTKLLNVLENSEKLAGVLWDRVLVQIVLILPVQRTHT